MRYSAMAAARAALSLALFVLAAGPAAGQAAVPAGQDPLFSFSGSLDWKSYRLDAVISLDLAKAGLRMPSGRSQAEGMVRDEAPRLLRDALLSLRVDSQRTLAAAIGSGDLSLDEVTRILEAPRPLKSSFSDDLRHFKSEYSVSILGILALMVRHSQARPPQAVLDYRPTKEYSGVVIYVPEELPVRGEFASDAFEPSLFPRIWDERMELVYERNMADPAAAKARGIVGYANDGESLPAHDRAGGEPLRILAIGLFGAERTDLVISREDALKILANPGNRALLAAGKVAIVSEGALTGF